MPRPAKRSSLTPLTNERLREVEADAEGFKTSKKQSRKGKRGEGAGAAEAAVPKAAKDVPGAPAEDVVLASMSTNSERVGFIWSVAELLRGDYKQSEYGRVVLPFTVLRRLDQVLAPTREAVRTAAHKHAEAAPALRERMLLRATNGQKFYNTSKFDFATLLGDPKHIARNLVEYIHGFSANARDIVEHFRFEEQIVRLDGSNLLFLLVKRFATVDLHPARVSNLDMGYVFEELIRRFSEQSNETAGEHFTPREVIRLMVQLLFVEDDAALSVPGTVRTMYDPACGTGGMLSVSEEHLHELHPQTTLHVYGQELNGESYAICKADMLIKGQDADRIKYGNSFSHDEHAELRVDYLMSNPPFGVDWTKAEKEIRKEFETKGHAGRFGPGLPRKNDGSLLFLLHMMSKMKTPEQGGSRLAIVFNGSPLFTGAAGSGESEIRRYLLENDLLEAIIGLPDQMFYNTGINTYVWLVTNRKPENRKGKVQLVNGVKRFRKMRKSLGEKRKELGDGDIEHFVRLFDAFESGPEVRIFDNEDFGFRRITVERPLRLDFQASAERVARLGEQKAWTELLASKKKDAAAREQDGEDGRKVQEGVLRALRRLDAGKVYFERASFIADLKEAMEAEEVGVSGAVRKAILAALGERNEAAAVCRVKGEVEADPELRDYENVPLKEGVAEYMRREVLPHVPDAWVDEGKTVIGYEIPFTRHFYEYVPPRAVEVIEGEIRALEEEIRGMLEGVLG
jgi:type I restriction enzyme M protein